MSVIKSFHRRTRRGNVVKILREHYLRDDINCGSDLCDTCEQQDNKLRSNASHYLVFDTNVALHQLDFIESASSSGELTDVIVMQTVINEMKHRNLSAFSRLRSLCLDPSKRFFVFNNEHHSSTYVEQQPKESPNDRNDRAIRFAIKWYAAHLTDSMRILFVTNDAACRQRALEEGLKAETVHTYVKKQHPKMVDLLAASPDDTEISDAETTTAGGFTRYPEHLGMAEIKQGILDGKFFQGVIRTGKGHPFEGFLRCEGSGYHEILVSGRIPMNRSMDGDVVVVEMLPKSQWVQEGQDYLGEDDLEEGADAGGEFAMLLQKNKQESGKINEGRACAKVIGIVKRGWRPYVGTIEPAGPGQSTVFFVPIDRKLPKIKIVTRQAENLIDKRIVVVLDAWLPNSKNPMGHYVRMLGDAGDLEVESEAILIEHDVPTRSFSPAVMRCLPPMPWEIPESEVKSRLDLRSYMVCSVDPPGCKDIDDALHTRDLGNGFTEVGVHIADVTWFMESNSPLDMEARDRATSVYLVNKRIDMLPSLLTTDLCSLRANVDRLTFSVLWVLDPSYNIVSTTFARCIINSKAALTYEQAQLMIDDESQKSELALALRRLNNVAKRLKNKRIEAGALNLASPEVRFQLDTETHDPVNVGMYTLRETNSMVEEMMLLANGSVAKKIFETYPNAALLRRHQHPPADNFKKLHDMLKVYGYNLKYETNKELADSLDLINDSKDPFFNKLVRILTTRCMTQAEYFAAGDVASPIEFYHYGLAANFYTHFTSPIRRYADDVVHRQLAAAIGLVDLPDDLTDPKSVSNISNGLNRRHTMAQFCGRASTELYSVTFFKTRPCEEDSYITSIRKNGVIVLIPRYGIECPVYLNHRGSPPKYLYNESKYSLVSASKTLKIFGKLRVKIRSEGVGAHALQLKLELADETEGQNLKKNQDESNNNKSVVDPMMVDAAGGEEKKKKKKKKKSKELIEDDDGDDGNVDGDVEMTTGGDEDHQTELKKRKKNKKNKSEDRQEQEQEQEEATPSAEKISKNKKKKAKLLLQQQQQK